MVDPSHGEKALNRLVRLKLQLLDDRMNLRSKEGWDRRDLVDLVLLDVLESVDGCLRFYPGTGSPSERWLHQLDSAATVVRGFLRLHGDPGIPESSWLDPT